MTRKPNFGVMGHGIISISPDVMGGTPVFPGTRVPVETLFDYLEAGDSIDEFLAGFPSVSRRQVVNFLEAAKSRLVATTMNASIGGSRASFGGT